MKSGPRKHHRRSIRLQGYDYSRPGAYFVTICTQNRQCLFGDVVDGEMVLNGAGRMVMTWYRELENKFSDICCDEFVIMPNHIHFIVINVGADLRVCPMGIPRVCPMGIPRVCPGDKSSRNNGQSRRIDGQSRRIAPTTGEYTGGEHTGSPLPAVVQWFKTMTTNEYIRGVKRVGWPRFDGKLWQRNYWEHVVRDEQELHRIREYIIGNPARWPQDRNYVGADLRVCPSACPNDAIYEAMPQYGDEPWMV